MRRIKTDPKIARSDLRPPGALVSGTEYVIKDNGKMFIVVNFEKEKAGMRFNNETHYTVNFFGQKGIHRNLPKLNSCKTNCGQIYLSVDVQNDDVLG